MRYVASGPRASREFYFIGRDKLTILRRNPSQKAGGVMERNGFIDSGRRLRHLRTQSSRCAALLLDLDGTLIDTEATCRAAFRAALAHWIEPTDGFPYRHLIGRATPDRRRLLRSWFNGRLPLEEFLAAYRNEREARFSRGIALKAGALELLAEARAAALPVAIVTAASRSSARRRMEQAGLPAVTLITRDDVPLTKPHPRCMLLAARALQTAPERCLVVEDSMVGVRAGRRAGMNVVLVPDLAPRAAYSGPVLPDLHTVAALIFRSDSFYRTQQRDAVEWSRRRYNTETPSPIRFTRAI